jgi:hypothetical protein
MTTPSLAPHSARDRREGPAGSTSLALLPGACRRGAAALAARFAAGAPRAAPLRTLRARAAPALHPLCHAVHCAWRGCALSTRRRGRVRHKGWLALSRRPRFAAPCACAASRARLRPCSAAHDTQAAAGRASLCHLSPGAATRAVRARRGRPRAAVMRGATASGCHAQPGGAPAACRRGAAAGLSAASAALVRGAEKAQQASPPRSLRATPATLTRPPDAALHAGVFAACDGGFRVRLSSSVRRTRGGPVAGTPPDA